VTTPQPKPCTAPGCDLPKRPGSPRYCEEDWLRRQPITRQIEAAQARLALVPPQLRRSRVPASEWPTGRRWCAACQTFVRIQDCTGSRCKADASAAAHRGSVTRTYGISAEQYEAIYRAQKGKCYLCGRKSNQRLSVDHAHSCCPGPVSCGKCVRGLLCAPERGCNRSLVGFVEWIAKNDRATAVAFARRLADYLENPPAPRILATVGDH
jgi:hypothetical protein